MSQVRDAQSHHRRSTIGADRTGDAGGRYLRGFWNPVYHSVDLKPAVRCITIMSEQLRSIGRERGRLFWSRRASARGTQLSSPGDGRCAACFYTDGNSRATDAARNSRPRSRFCDSVDQRPGRCGISRLVFAYSATANPEFRSTRVRHSRGLWSRLYVRR